METNKNIRTFHRVAIGVLIYTLVVILWGAWVRISHSGDGCGNSWPLCHGNMIPQAPAPKTWVEFSHRLSSGFFGILIVFMVWCGRKVFSSEHRLRKVLYASLFFTVTEALLGAKLVLSGLVGKDDSAYRLFVMSLHQLNSLMLTGSIALVVLYSGVIFQRAAPSSVPDKIISVKKRTWWFFLLFVLIPITGGFAALSTTLFPSSSLLEGITQDFSAHAHYLIRLRIWHPIVATIVGGGLALFFWMRSQQQSEPTLRKATLQVALIFSIGIVFGYLTLFSLAPLWMKIVHLLLAHLIWIALLRWGALERHLRQS